MRQRRSAYTLLEVMLALVVAVLLLSAMYSVLGYQLRQAQAGRDLIERTTLARAVLDRIQGDVIGAVALGSPSRFRTPASSQSSGATSTTTTATATTGTTTGTTTTGTASATTSTTTTGMDASASATASTAQPVTLPLGVLGSDSELHLFVSKFPNEVYGATADQAGQLTCDLRRVSYWMGENGLCRIEQRLITSEDAASTELPTGDTDKYLLAGEARSFEVQYFDGTAWASSWDSTEVGADGVTPKGSPRAIKVRIGLAPPGQALDGAEPELKYHTQTILIPTAGGPPPATISATAEGATAP